MDQLEDHEFKMEVYLDEPEKINDYNSENQANSSPRRRTTRKRATPKESSDSSDSENDEVKDSNALKRVQLLEKQLRACCKELNDMRDENLALRENNVKYQVEIFKLRRQNLSASNGKEPKLTFLQRYQEIVNTQTQQMAKTDQIVHRKKRIAEIKDQHQIKLELAEKIKQFKTSEIPLDEDGNPIEMTDSDVGELADIEPTMKGDSKFVNKMLTILFDNQTLLNSTITGKCTQNPNQCQRDTKPLDMNKVLYMRQLFTKRVKKEKVKKVERKEREKMVNQLVNNKICNLRKGEIMKKTKLLKLKEEESLEDPFYA